MAKSSKFPFSIDFQKKLLSLLIKNYKNLLAEDVVDPSYFEDPIDSQVAELVLSLFLEFRKVPTLKIIGQELKGSLDKEEFRLFVKRLKEVLREKIPEVERGYLLSEVRRFAGIQSVKKAITDSIEPLKAGDLEQVRSNLRSSLTVGDRDTLPEVDFFGDVRKRSFKATERGVRTLIGDLDMVLRGGGLCRRELGVGLALSSVGKTMFLIHLAKAAVLQNLQVVYFSLDDTADLISERLDASFSGVETVKLGENRAKVIRKIDKYAEWYGGQLIIKECFPKKTNTITMDAYLDKLDARGFKPDMVVVDYANITGTTNDEWTGNRYKSLGSVYEDLKLWAKERNMAVWTGAQAHRGALHLELTTMGEIAESFEGIMHSNLIVSLNRNAEEKKQEKVRLYLVKNKSQVSEIQIDIRTNYKRGSFYRISRYEDDD